MNFNTTYFSRGINWDVRGWIDGDNIEVEEIGHKGTWFDMDIFSDKFIQEIREHIEGLYAKS